MKAAVMFKKWQMPKYSENFLEPVTNGEDEILISVRAAAIKNLYKSRTSGKHYSARMTFFREK